MNIENIYHVYNQGVNKQVLYQSKEDVWHWLNLVRISAEKYNVRVFCFVTMVNHYHLLVQGGEMDVSQFMWFVGNFYSKAYNLKYDRVGPLFRGRYKKQIIEDHHYLRSVVNYIHNNPVVAGVVDAIESENELVASSYKQLIGQDNRFNWLCITELLELLGFVDKDNLLSHCRKVVTHGELVNIQKKIKGVTQMGVQKNIIAC